MTKWQEFKVGFLRALTWCIFRLGVYGTWSKAYQAIWERQREPLKQFSSMGDFVAYIRTFKWRPDSWRQLWDAYSNPYHVQWVANNDPLRLVGDCEDFSIYEVTVLATQPWLLRGATDVGILTVTWFYPNPEPGQVSTAGHNVCLIQYDDGCFSWMDYNYPHVRSKSVQEVVAHVLSQYAPEAVLIRWGRCDRNLHYFDTDTKC